MEPVNWFFDIILSFFAKFKNVVHCLEAGETPSNSASHQAPNYCATFLNIAKYFKTLRCGCGAVAFFQFTLNQYCKCRSKVMQKAPVRPRFVAYLCIWGAWFPWWRRVVAPTGRSAFPSVRTQSKTAGSVSMYCLTQACLKIKSFDWLIDWWHFFEC